MTSLLYSYAEKVNLKGTLTTWYLNWFILSIETMGFIITPLFFYEGELTTQTILQPLAVEWFVVEPVFLLDA